MMKIHILAMKKDRLLNTLGINILLTFTFIFVWTRIKSHEEISNLEISVKSHNEAITQFPNRDFSFSSDEARLFENGYSNLTNCRYLQYVRHKWILEPSKAALSLEYHKENQDYSQEGQSPFV